MDRCQSNNDLNINRYFQKNSDWWLVILKMSDISGSDFYQFDKNISIYRFANLDIDRYFRTYRKHRFVELVILQIPKNLDLSKSNNRKKVIEPSIANHEKNIGCPPLETVPHKSTDIQFLTSRNHGIHIPSNISKETLFL